MIGLGTIINVLTVVIGSALGLIFKNIIPKRLEKTVVSGIGLSVCFIGISGVLSKMLYIDGGAIKTRYTMLMVISLVLGAVIGELINIEKHLESFGDFCKSKVKLRGENSRFTEGFVSASLLFCVGAMAIIGSIEDGLAGDPTTLVAKAVMDGTVSIFFAASFGAGVFLSAIPVLIYQGAITLLAGVVEPLLSDTLINQVSLVGSVLILGIGINMLSNAKIKLGNLLPAVLIPIFYNIILSLF